MGCGLDKRIAFVKQKFHFRPYPPAYPPTDEARKHVQNLRLRVPPISAHPPTAPFFMGGFPHIYICLKDTKQKNTTHIYVRARMHYGRMGGNGRNPEIRTIPTFARVFTWAGPWAERAE